MRRSQHTDDEIAFLLKEAESGIAITAICASAGVSLGTFYRWRRRLGGLPPKAVSRLRHIEEENGRLRAELARLTQDGTRASAEAAAAKTAPSLRALIATDRPAASPRHRGGDVSVGRFAFVRTTH